MKEEQIMKREYVIPELQVVLIQTSNSLLAGSIVDSSDFFFEEDGDLNELISEEEEL